jgi:hypothetical protein
MQKEKVLNVYNVYYIGKGNGCYAEDYCKTFVGRTKAVSPEKACSQVRWRNRNKNNPNGGYSINVLGDRLEEGFVTFTYKAELVE